VNREKLHQTTFPPTARLYPFTQKHGLRSRRVEVKAVSNITPLSEIVKAKREQILDSHNADCIAKSSKDLQSLSSKACRANPKSA
jgi:hypothetical protein